MGANIREFFNDERGITDETLAAFEVSFEGDDCVHLPYTSGVKGRRLDDDGKRHFYFVEGDANGLFLSPGWIDEPSVAFVVEGETDAMRLWQELQVGGSDAVVAGISGINGWTDDLARFFANIEDVYVILDNDVDYKVTSVTDTCWRHIKASLGPKARRLELPKSPAYAKDVCEFFDMYDLDVLREIVAELPELESNYTALDLTVPAPPTEWLVKGMVAAGDVCMWVGEPEVGKSMLTMDLAVAVADNRDEFLGKEIMKHGRVLYVDEENPEDVVRQRLERFGLDVEATENLRYLHHQSVRLDKHPERLIDEAIAYQPTLIIIDSLTRIHAGDENSAGFIAGLFNDGINPLARTTGAAVVILHHVNKSDGDSAFGRVRGSSDIVGTIDSGYDFNKAGQFIRIHAFKSRRVKSGGSIMAEIVDTPSGGLEIATRKAMVF